MKTEQDYVYRVRDPGKRRHVKLSRLIAGSEPGEPVRRPEVQPNTVIRFGHYYYERGMNKSFMEWLVLKREGNTVLLVARQAIDYMRYHRCCQDVSWQDCSLREWLNGEFIAESFSGEEQLRILETRCPGTLRSSRNNECHDTTDRVFLLSEKEAETWFRDHAARECVATPYAMFRRRFGSSMSGLDMADSCLNVCFWLLRQTETGTTLLGRSIPGKQTLVTSLILAPGLQGFVRPALRIRL